MMFTHDHQNACIFRTILTPQEVAELAPGESITAHTPDGKISLTLGMHGNITDPHLAIIDNKAGLIVQSLMSTDELEQLRTTGKVVQRKKKLELTIELSTGPMTPVEIPRSSWPLIRRPTTLIP